MEDLLPAAWQPFQSVGEWWTMIARLPSNDAKGLHSLIILVIWEIWLECNARIFKHKESLCPMVISRIKDQVSNWMALGAKHLAALLA